MLCYTVYGTRLTAMLAKCQFGLSECIRLRHKICGGLIKTEKDKLVANQVMAMTYQSYNLQLGEHQHIYTYTVRSRRMCFTSTIIYIIVHLYPFLSLKYGFFTVALDSKLLKSLIAQLCLI